LCILDILASSEIKMSMPAPTVFSADLVQSRESIQDFFTEMKREGSKHSRRDSTTWYDIRVTDIDGTTSYTRKRYRDFAELHKKLTLTPGVTGLPAMPPKSFFRKTFRPTGSHMAERKQMLARILKTASSQPATLPALRDFVPFTSVVRKVGGSLQGYKDCDATGGNSSCCAAEVTADLSMCDVVDISSGSTLLQIQSITSPIDYVAAVPTTSDSDLLAAFIGLSVNDRLRLERILTSIIEPRPCNDVASEMTETPNPTADPLLVENSELASSLCKIESSRKSSEGERQPGGNCHCFQGAFKLIARAFPTSL
jgi:hypothetical protein